ncbi:hypothetical protein CNR22_21000 [Sphingobacteriaceae bacterium]|nr:hypothetical protein CNR22_21000 [Sphingobacteriaceae bacterium]
MTSQITKHAFVPKKNSSKKTLLFLFLTLATVTLSRAQHCKWDQVSAIIVEVRDNATGQLVNGLDITLTDSLGKPYKMMAAETVKFNQNKADHKQYAETGGPFAFEQHFYVLSLTASAYPHLYNHGNALIEVKDKDGAKNGAFKPKSVSFYADNIVSLCTNHSIWNDEKSMEKVKVLILVDRNN